MDHTSTGARLSGAGRQLSAEADVVGAAKHMRVVGRQRFGGSWIPLRDPGVALGAFG